MAARSSGALRGTASTLIRIGLENLGAFLIVVTALWLAHNRKASPRYLILAGTAALSGVFLFNQNAGGGILILLPATMLAAFAPAKKQPTTELALMAVLALPLMAMHGFTLAKHSLLASRHYATDLDGIKAGLPGAYSITDLAALRAAYHRGQADLELVSDLGTLGYPQRDQLYLETIKDGETLLKNSGEKGAIVTLDIANPFDAALDRPAAEDAELALADGRTFSLQNHRPAPAIFGNARIIMDPKSPWLPGSRRLLWRLYGDWIAARYVKAAESDYWTLWQRRTSTSNQPVRPQPRQ
jgi:hypothetical protein